MTPTSPPSDGAGGRGRGTLWFLATVLLTLLADQLTKTLVIRALPPGGAWPESGAITRFFTFTHVENTGVAFGMFQGRSELFLLVSLVVVAGLLVYRHRLPGDAVWLNVATGLMVGGALGNVIDRLRIGHVTDFFDFQHWPVFNVADSAIFIGVVMLAWYTWQEERQRTAAEKAGDTTGTGTWPPAAEEPGD